MPKTISPERILYEDNDLLIVNKLSGELVVAAPGESDKEPLYDFLHKTHPGLRVVHRLDYATSGVIVFAKTAEALRVIRDAKFAGWKKTYRTIVAKPMKNRFGTINRKLSARTKDELVDAVTHYRVIELFPHATYVEVDIETGRKHQIRQHLQFIGHPLLNDSQYGDPRFDRAFKKHHKYRRMFLYASKLVFPHPITGKEMTITAPMPKAFEEVLKELKTAPMHVRPESKPKRPRGRGDGSGSGWMRVDEKGKAGQNFKTAKVARRARGTARKARSR